MSPIPENINMILIRHLSNHVRKCQAIPVVMKNVPSFISMGQDVIQPTLILYAPCSAHTETSISDAVSGQAFYSLCKMWHRRHPATGPYTSSGSQRKCQLSGLSG